MNVAELKSDVRFLLGNIDSVSYSDNEILNNLNRWLEVVQNEIIDAMQKTFLQFGETYNIDLVKDQEQYTFPSGLLTIEAIEVNYTGNQWEKARIFPISDYPKALSEESNFVQSHPAIFILDDDTFLLKPAPEKNVSSGLKIWYTKKAVALSSDSDTPPFNSNFHRILSLGASLDYAVAMEMRTKITYFNEMLAVLFEKLRKFYVKRQRTSKARIVPRNVYPFLK